MNIRKKVNWTLVILIIVFCITRIVLSFSSMKYVDGEEAVYGVMAKMILENGDHPLLCWGQAYSGACALHGYLVTIPYSIFGSAQFIVRIFNILLSLGILIVSYFFTKKHFNHKTAVITSVLLIFASPFFIRFNLIHFPYMITLFFQTLIIYLLYEIWYNKKNSYLIFALLGFLIGFSVYNLELIIPFLFMCAIFWFIHNPKFIFRKQTMVLIMFLIIGISPLIYYNATHDNANIKQFFAGTIFHKVVCKFGIIPQEINFNGRIVNHCKLFTTTRAGNPPDVFIGKVVPGIFGDGLFGIVIFSLTLLSIVYLMYTLLKMYKKRMNSKNILDKGILVLKDKKSFIIMFSLLFPFADFFSGFADTRHLLPLFPFVYICVSLAIIKLFENKGIIQKVIAAVISGIFLANSVFGYYSLMTMHEDNDETEVIHFLNNNNIKYAYSTSFLQYRLLFQSDVRIIVSCEGICPLPYKYPYFENTVSEKNKYAYVFIKDNNYEVNLKKYLGSNNVSYSLEMIKNRAIYYNFSEDVRPSMFVANKTMFGE